jgi:H+/Cl- antiporter ClcA
MMKYRGPKDEYKIIERAYIRRLVAGFIISLIGLAAGRLAFAFQGASVVYVDQEGRANLRNFTNDSPTLLVALGPLAIGMVISLLAIKKYRSDFSEIKNKVTRPEKNFVATGIGLMALELVVGVLGIFAFPK